MSTSTPATTPAQPVREVPDWYALPAERVLSALGSAQDGLTEVQAATLLASAGPNRVRRRRAEPWWKEFFESFTEPLQLLLVAVAVLSFVFGELPDALAILGVILLCAGLETFSEQRASRGIAALETLSAPQARVLRDMIVRTVPSEQVVPGDVLVLEAGDVVTADARLLDAHGLRVDESALTGEATSAAKSATPVPAGTDLAERSSVLFAGASVVDGQGRAVVVGTGADTELGRLGRSVQEQTEPRTPLQAAMAELARLVLVLAVVVSVAVPLLGVLFAGQRAADMLLTGLTLAFATVPEELPILVTVLLAVGGLQLARRGALLRRLSVGEALGAVTYLLTDKTGTLTVNQLTLAQVHGERRRVLAVAWAAQGGPEADSREPMDAAIAEAAGALPGTAPPGQLVAVWPFDSDRKRVSRAWVTDGHAWLAVGGAPEAVFAVAAAGEAEKWEPVVAELSAAGHRVIAYASRDLPAQQAAGLATGDQPSPGEAERDLIVAGLGVFDDPLREGVPEAVAELQTAGVATVVVTGDHPATGRAVAAAAGLPDGATLRGGAALAGIDDAELAGRLVDGTVIGRATPADKLRLVRLLQNRGQVVAVTGDGVNDAPALAAADVGVAMGRRGTDLARQAAGLVLTDDAYPTVVRAVEKGRSVTSQLRRAVAFYLGAKVALVSAMVIGLLAGYPVPFAPVQIVLLELFMDLGASVAFVSEPVAPAAMLRPPRPRTARFVDAAFGRALASVALTLTVAVAPTYLLLSRAGTDLGQARAGAVFAWLAGHALIAWTLRARPGLPWRANPAFPAWAASALGTACVLTLTPAAALVRLQALTSTQLLTAAGCTALAVTLAALARRLSRAGATL